MSHWHHQHHITPKQHKNFGPKRRYTVVWAQILFSPLLCYRTTLARIWEDLRSGNSQVIVDDSQISLCPVLSCITNYVILLVESRLTLVATSSTLRLSFAPTFFFCGYSSDTSRLTATEKTKDGDGFMWWDFLS